ncbi:hypothetical protein P691DRAFT_656905 [Macrolepiota fuliginosa MF-IS2]|uniref:Conserved oligomeric Golgi complex subunit 1 n=1 Tax=Macrolepiota fuliginosa MF-IS2 TaxID=1400762 RepID=A0A9P5XPD9_9AGAR|nr:hypothetical protein P691DRAFT_656905 [Macrolepiota fuliginosa MF-IS2]
MFRRPSTVQATPLPIGNGSPFTKTPSTASVPEGQIKRPVSNTATVTTIGEVQDFTPGELFTKHTVSEIKVIQNRLRADADVKKEELRQMVGERYRDLLQASSSIISIAHSSKQVVKALDESRVAIQSQEDPPLPKASSVANRHLHALQVLAAHMKLLLDAPEHLWRLIERKKFFPAAWLFLLARVVHRALVRSDEQDEETWRTQGVDVLIEFPLIQRQWDVVSQFRSQIIHKATLWLRDVSSTVEDTCATLVTLHLLDSRPLHDTLASVLSQRSKTLNISLAAKGQLGSSPMASNSRRSANGKITFSFSQDTSTSSLVKPRIREVKESLHNAFTIISQTMHVARGVFDGKSGLSLVERVLEFIQSDVEKNIDVPTELHLTTQALLTNVTSTAHFQLLPQNLQSYKPYVDLTSPSASLRQDQFLKQLNEWFNQSTQLLQGAVERWFRELETVREVWSVRVAWKKWVGVSTLAEGERARILSTIDQICRVRIVEIWKSMLKAASGTFETILEVSLRSVNSNELETVDLPVDYLFNTVPLPILSQSPSNFDIPLRKYQGSLRQQLLGRTASVDKVLNTLEQCARHIHDEISFIRSDSRNETRSIVDLLTELHEPAAEKLTKSSLHALENAIDQTRGDDDGSIRKLVFLGQVTEDLASRSYFINQIGCGQISGDMFIERLSTLNDTILDSWKHKTVARIIRRASPSLRVIPTSPEIDLVTGPAPELVQVLALLYAAMQEITFKWDRAKQTSFAQDTLPLFVEAWLSEGTRRVKTTEHNLMLLRELAKLASGPNASGIIQQLENKLKQPVDLPGLGQDASEYAKRLQTLLPATLACPDQEKSPNRSVAAADKFPNLLRYGPPSTGYQQLQTSPDFAKPGPRFGLLLVGGDNSG